MRADQIFVLFVKRRLVIEIVAAVRARHGLVLFFVEVFVLVLFVVVIVAVASAFAAFKLVELVLDVRNVLVELFKVGVQFLVNVLVLFNRNSQKFCPSISPFKYAIFSRALI